MGVIPGVENINADARLRGFTRQHDDGFHFPVTALWTLVTPDLLWSLGIAPTVSDSKTVTANTTFTIPAGWAIDNIYLVSTNANAVTGGIRIGTTNGGTQVVDTIAVPGNSIVDTFQSLDWTLKQRLFSKSADTTLYVQAVTAWNSASVDIAIQRTRVF